MNTQQFTRWGTLLGCALTLLFTATACGSQATDSAVTHADMSQTAHTPMAAMNEVHDDADHDSMAAAAAHGIPEEAAAMPNPVAYDAASVETGAEVFAQTCAVCHGPEGAGDGPGAAALEPKPADLRADHVQANSDGGLFYIISEGRAGTAMPAWEETISEAQRWHLVNFIRFLVAE